MEFKVSSFPVISGLTLSFRTVAIYIEDGNEVDNMVSYNVGICARQDHCKSANLHWQDNGEGGIYGYGMTNDLIGNRMAGHEHGLWLPGGIKPRGKGHAEGKVCPQNTPFGIIRGNVFHDSGRFGTYLDNQYPRNLIRDANGYVIDDRKSCNQFTADGEDNGLVSVIEDNLDYHNIFSGGYDFGDISFVRSYFVNQAHNMYWKKSKNMADKTSAHLQDCVFLNSNSDPGMSSLVYYSLDVD